MTDKLSFLKTTDLFGGVPSDRLSEILDDMQEIRAEAGTTVFRKGDDGDAVYLILTGSLRLESDGVHLVNRGQGECVGEFALIDHAPRSASAVSERDSVLLRWDRDAFQRVLVQSPDVARGIFRTLTGKLRENIATHVDFALESERWRQDLQRAREIQMGMLPAGELDLGHTEVSGYCRAAVEVGGDYYDYLPFETGQLGVVIGDVTGHGFYSGLFVAMAKSCLHTQATIDYGPAHVMKAMRRTLSLSIDRGMLMSCCYVLIDAAAQTLSYANAGHPYPYHVSGSDGRMTRLEALDPILGALDSDDSRFQQVRREWNEGDCLVLYSDGVTEARSPAGQMFGHERLEEVIAGHSAHSALHIRVQILEAVSKHCATAMQQDDLTIAVVKSLPRSRC